MKYNKSLKYKKRCTQQRFAQQYNIRVKERV